jgi:lysophospholipase
MNYFLSPLNSVKIAYDIFPASNEKGRVLFLTGRAEYYLKYRHFFNILNEKGFSVYAMDHRGQGASGRLLKEHQKGHVEKFDDFVEDADFFLKNFVMKECGISLKPVSLSHSMGGAVSLLLGMKNPGLFKKMIFCSPMWGINFGKIPECVIYRLSQLFCYMGAGEKYALGKGDFNFDHPFENNGLTHDPERFNEQRSFLKENPDFLLGGPTNRWAFESVRMIRKLKSIPINTGCEVLLLQAGADPVVSNFHQNLIIKKIGHSTKIRIENSWHELLFEEKSIYFQAVNNILKFLEN